MRIIMAVLAYLAFAVPASAQREFIPHEAYFEATAPAVQRFIVADAFHEDVVIGGRKLSMISFDFGKHFGAVVEENVPETLVKGSKLVYTAGDKSIVKALGGEQKATLRFAHIFYLMSLGTKPNHVDMKSNFAYVRSPLDKRMWAIHWSTNYQGEWNIGMVQVPHRDLDWNAGSHLFSE